ncbi:MAG: hypothetical protein AB2L20_17585 [Mangrovibacterium sp.]
MVSQTADGKKNSPSGRFPLIKNDTNEALEEVGANSIYHREYQEREQ